MNDFDFDCAQKKRIARGAFNRKGTTNRKGCRLPHENLTKKELEKLNGEITTVSMLSPISWATFKALAPDLQEEYLDTQVRRFGVGLATIGRELFGFDSDNKLSNYVRDANLSIIPAPPGRQPKAAKESWNRWLATGTTIAPETETTTEPTPETTPIAAKEKETDCRGADAPRNDAGEVKPFRAHDHKADPLLQLFTDCGLERETDGRDQSEPEDGLLYPLTGMNLELKGTPIDILATLRMSFPALLDKDKTYRFTIKVDTYTICETRARDL